MNPLPSSLDLGEQVSPAARPRRRRRGWWIVAAVAAVLVVVGGTVGAVASRHHTDGGVLGCRQVAYETAHKIGANAYTSTMHDQQMARFRASKHLDLRQAGVTYIGVEWTSYQQVQAGDLYSIDYGAIADSYAALAAVCEQYGVAVF